MESATISLYDVFRRMMPETEAREAETAFLTAVRQEAKAVQRETVQKNLPSLVETAFATEIRHLATREGLAVLEGKVGQLATKEEMHSQNRALLYWTIGGFITLLASIIATLLVLLQMQHTAGMPQ